MSLTTPLPSAPRADAVFPAGTPSSIPPLVGSDSCGAVSEPGPPPEEGDASAAPRRSAPVATGDPGIPPASLLDADRRCRILECGRACGVVPDAEHCAALLRRYNKINPDPDAGLSFGEFRFCIGVPEEPSRQLFELFDLDGDGTVDRHEFINGMAVLVLNGAPTEDKTQFIFRMFDLDANGIIDGEEMFHIAQVLHPSASAMSEDELVAFVKHIFEEFDTNGDYELDFAEFQCVLARYPFLLSSLDQAPPSGTCMAGPVP